MDVMNQVDIRGICLSSVKLAFENDDGKALAVFTLAVPKSFRSRDTFSITVQCWDALARSLPGRAGKGDDVTVHGRIGYDLKENLVIIADSVEVRKGDSHRRERQREMDR